MLTEKAEYMSPFLCYARTPEKERGQSDQRWRTR
jgi:hypothetical protein